MMKFRFMIQSGMIAALLFALMAYGYAKQGEVSEAQLNENVESMVSQGQKTFDGSGVPVSRAIPMVYSPWKGSSFLSKMWGEVSQPATTYGAVGAVGMAIAGAILGGATGFYLGGLLGGLLGKSAGEQASKEAGFGLGGLIGGAILGASGGFLGALALGFLGLSIGKLIGRSAE